ncbi:MAG: 30S ribosomal protein S12 methylthiotransferase RimO [Treponema sp.]|nr:30S ribosomal protein S12 methylthiotransferase RimO [Treponema sp.]
MFYFLDPFGCAKNQVDAEIMAARLNKAGWAGTDDPDGADLIIVNSCGFIEAAKRESINAVLAWKKQYPEKKILLAGCLTQRYRSELEENLTEADGFAGCDDLDRVPERAAEIFQEDLIKPAKSGTQSSAAPAFGPPAESGAVLSSDRGLRPLLGFPGSAYVKISEGCSNRCSFCAIPLIRGPLRCRVIPDIVEECKQLLDRGVKEICLIGQDLASYALTAGGTAKGISALASLLEAIAGLTGDFWIRLLYLHPDHFPLDILDITARDRRFLPYFDIPFQHASFRILSFMERSGSGETYLRLLDRIRSRIPDAVIRSTFLVGFPGETEEDFETLLAFQQQARFDWLGVFAWSREEGTAAYSFKGRVSKKTAARRKALIEEQQVSITEEKMNRFVGRNLDVLVEEELADTPDPGNSAHESSASSLWLGRFFLQAPEVDGAAVIRTVPAAGIPALKPGALIRGTVQARRGFDLEVLVQQ